MAWLQGQMQMGLYLIRFDGTSCVFGEYGGKLHVFDISGAMEQEGKMPGSAYRWAFARIGGVDQVVIRNGEDILHISELDRKLWAALAMPGNMPGIRDSLAFLDGDSDGRVRAQDVIEGVNFLGERLDSLNVVFDQTDSLAVDVLKGENLKAGARKVLSVLGIDSERSPAASISLSQIDDATSKFAGLPLNGDGIIEPASAGREDLSSLMKTMIDAGYGTPGPDGSRGVDAGCVERFLADAKAFALWSDEAKDKPGLIPYGEKSPAVLSLYGEIRGMVDDFYKRCRILAMANSDEIIGELRAVFSSHLAKSAEDDAGEYAGLPLALPDKGAVLDIEKPLHPKFEDSCKAFFQAISAAEDKPRKEVTFGQWNAIKAQIAPYMDWIGRKPQTGVEDLGEASAHSYEKDARFGELLALIEKDKTDGKYIEHFRELKKLSLLKRDFLRILRNFVNFDDFYLRKDGVFQSGRLFIDGRELEYCMEVNNPAAHATMAGLSSTYLIYCDCSNKVGGKKSIVAALTAGNADTLFTGRNGLYYDASNSEWDAVITKMIAQPVSIREAFFSPYKWFVKTLEDLAMKRAASAEAASIGKAKGAAETTVNVATKPEAAPAILPKKIDVGTVAAIGVALGSIGAMLTGILSIFVGMGVWMPIGLLSVVVLISGPSMILAYMKLRKRNIGPLLNAEGWAVNGKLKVNVPFGATLSHLAVLPLGSSRQINDPFAQKRRPWLLYFIIALIVALAISWAFGWLDPLLSSLGLR